jgi:hypothetical protein
VLAAWIDAIHPRLDEVGILVALIAAVNCLIRIVLCGLAAYATWRALGEAGTTEDAHHVRAHQLAVLQALLTALSRPRMRGYLRLPKHGTARATGACKP